MPGYEQHHYRFEPLRQQDCTKFCKYFFLFQQNPIEFLSYRFQVLKRVRVMLILITSKSCLNYVLRSLNLMYVELPVNQGHEFDRMVTPAFQVLWMRVDFSTMNANIPAVPSGTCL